MTQLSASISTKKKSFQIDEDDDDETRYKPIDMKMVRRLLSWLPKYKWKYITGISIGLFVIFVQNAGPRYVGKLVDYCTQYLGSSLIPRAQAITHVLWLMLPWAILLAISTIVDRIRILVMTTAGESVQFDLRRALFSHLQSLSMSFYDRTKLGRIISR